VRVLVLTTFDEDEWVFDAIRYGADGYLLKDTPQEDLIKAIVDTRPAGGGQGAPPHRISTYPAIARLQIGQPT